MTKAFKALIGDTWRPKRYERPYRNETQHFEVDSRLESRFRSYMGFVDCVIKPSAENHV